MNALRHVAIVSTLLAVFLLCSACSPTVQEDRSINYSTDGSGVAFQHGDEGVFVADSDGQKVEQVFETSDTTIAVSSPLWSPTDKRLIFTTARSANADGQLSADLAAWDANPEGRQFAPEDTVYTCMLRPAPDGGETPPATALFEASCNHPGYVAANLAVRWHPQGNSVLFVDRTDGDQHSLFEFDLATRQRQRVLPHSAAALIFDWTPGGSHLVCVLAGGVEGPAMDGIWIRPAKGDEWWQVPESNQLGVAASQAVLEQLRATRPVWTQDEQRFAFVGGLGAPAADGRNERQAIREVELKSREAKLLYETSGRLSDLHWDPKKGSLGFVESTDSASLRIVAPSGVVSKVASEVRVRRFAGWNHDGSKLAYITPSPSRKSTHWARLFPPVPESRDQVYVASGNELGKVVHSGLRITFPQWSPTENTLSLWGTYTPTHRSLLSAFLPWTLRPGDPAAIFNCDSGEITWMAINSHEQSQVGHYYLLRHEYEEAWRWYERAAENREAPQPVKLSEMESFLRRVRIHNDSTFFEYFCLTKLGRVDEAEERLRQFRTVMSFEIDLEELPGFPDQWKGREQEVRDEIAKFFGFATPLIQSAYMTEVFLSLNAAADGIAFFENELESATTDQERLATLLCLSQLHLVTDAHDAYAELATTQLAPLLMQLIDSPSLLPNMDVTDPAKLRRGIEDFTILVAGGAALEPLTSKEFLAEFSEPQLRERLTSWRELAGHAQNDAESLAADMILAAILKQLDDDEYQEIEKRIEANPLNGALQFAAEQ